MANHSPYRDQFAQQAYVACSESGMTDVQLAKLFGVCKATINVWKKKHPEFAEQIRKGRDEFDSANVEDKLLKRAMGYTYTETTMERDEDTGEMVEVKKVKRHIPPDTAAQRYWLNNRQPERWKNVKHVEADVHQRGEMKINIVNYDDGTDPAA
jgi:transposase-like protein